MKSAHPFTLAEFGQLVSAALESESKGSIDPEPLATTTSSRRSFLSFSTPISRRLGTTSPTARSSLSPSPKSFFQKSRMLLHPVPMHPIDAMSHLDLTQSCIPVYPTPTTPSRPRARQVLSKIKRQASALVKSPTKRLLSQPDRSLRVPTVTFDSASEVESSLKFRTSHEDDACSTTTCFHIDAPPAGDFMPYLPRTSTSYATDASVYHPNPSSSSRRTPAPTPPPLVLFDTPTRRPVIPPPSPSPSDCSDSTSSSRSPVTPVFSSHYDVHPYASPAAMSPRWSFGSDEQDHNNDPFAKGKVQIVRRSLIPDNFLLACAAVDDSQSSPSPEDNSRSPKGKRSSAFKKKPTISLPPSKPPPSCPLPSTPPTDSESSISALSIFDTPSTPPVVDEEWTLFLGSPSSPLEVPQLLEPKSSARERSGSSSTPSPSKQHLSPTDIPPQVQQQPRQRTLSNRSTCSNATTRRVESGPAPNSELLRDAERDWTLSLPVLRKPKSSSDTSIKVLEPPPEAKTRKCRSFTDWTMNLSDAFEKEQARLREVERERHRERKMSRVSAKSNDSAKGSQLSRTVKRLPIGPGPSSPPKTQPLLPPTSTNASTSSLNRAVTKSTASLRSCASSSSVSSYSSSASSYKDILPFDPCAPGVAPVSPITPTFSTYADSILTIPAPHSPSAAASFSNLANFPLPPSFSSKLLQRRSAAPPLPKPLLPTGTYKSYKPSALSSSAVYVEPSRASTSIALPRMSSLSAADLDAHVASSAPATSLNFPSSVFASGTLKRTSGSLRRTSETLRRTSGSLRRKNSNPVRRDSLNERPDSYYYRPTTSSSIDSTTSTVSSTSTVSAASSKSSIRSVSSASTVVPRGKTPQLMTRVADGQEVETTQVSPVRSSFDSFGRATEYDTCMEDGFSDEEIPSPRRRRDEEDSIRSECFYSARSSLDL